MDKIFIAVAEKSDRITTNSVNQAKQAIDRLHAALNMIDGRYTETYIAGQESKSVATREQDGIIDGVSTRDKSQLELTEAISFDSSLGSASALLSATALTKTVKRLEFIWCSEKESHLTLGP